MTLIYLVMLGCWIFFSIWAVVGFIWAVRKGHFEDFEGAAASIFYDEDEP
ncbi:MAG: cbb3-type cytochrome oxidase assembly protein CcoS [Bradymonadaceae bacterium]